MPMVHNQRCRICKEWIDVDEDEIAAFPPLVDGDSEFRIFNDTVIHRRCFATHPLSRELRSMLGKAYDPHNEQQQSFLAYIDELLTDDNDPSEQNDDDAPE
jgi:hypothetical protein